MSIKKILILITYILLSTVMMNIQAQQFEFDAGNKSAMELLVNDDGIDVDYNNPDCSALLEGKFLDWLNDAYFVIQIGAIVFTVVTGILGFTGAVASSDDDAIKKTAKKLKTRLIITVILILLPVVLEFILGLVEIPGLTNTDPLCK